MTGTLPEGPARDLARLLAARLDDREGPADAAITVAELRRELLPYPRCRQAAGLASKAEYDLALLDLLAEPDALEVDDPDLAEAVERERSAAEPGLGFLEGFAASRLRPGPAVTGAGTDGAATDGSDAGGGGADGGGTDGAGLPGGDRRGDESGAPAGGPATAAGASPAPDGPARREDREPGGGKGAGEGAREREASAAGCWECGRELPARDGLRYCPWCGADQRSPRCDACREPVESGWSYCPACGASVGG